MAQAAVALFSTLLFPQPSSLGEAWISFRCLHCHVVPSGVTKTSKPSEDPAMCISSHPSSPLRKMLPFEYYPLANPNDVLYFCFIMSKDTPNGNTMRFLSQNPRKKRRNVRRHGIMKNGEKPGVSARKHGKWSQVKQRAVTKECRDVFLGVVRKKPVFSFVRCIYKGRDTQALTSSEVGSKSIEEVEIFSFQRA